MKVALILAVAGLAVAQNFSGEPACATSCLSSAVTRAGCALDDQACQCGPTQSAIGAFAAPCLLSACTSGSDLIIAATVGSKLCAAFSSSVATTTGPSTRSTGGISITSTISDSSPGASTTAVVSSASTTTTSSSSSSSASSTSGTSSSSTTSASSVSGNLAAAATPAVFGALAALMGVVAAL